MKTLSTMLALMLSACGSLASDKQSAYDIQQVLKSGGSVTISATRFSSYDAQTMAKAALEGNSTLIVRDGGERYSTYDMQTIGSAGPGHVTFE